MKSNRSEGLRILVRQSALTEKDWFALLETRRALIAPHLHDMTLKTLGDLKIVRDYKGGHSSERPLRMGAMTEQTTSRPPFRTYREMSEICQVEGPFQLDTRGIFPDDEIYYHGHFKWKHIYNGNGSSPATGLTLRFWGLTRDGEWFKAEMTERYFTQMRGSDYDSREESRSEVTRFFTERASAEEICTFCAMSPWWIWKRLGDATRVWLKHRESLLSDAQYLVDVVEREEMLLKVVQEK